MKTETQVVAQDGKTQPQPAGSLTDNEMFGTIFNTGNKTLDDLLTDFRVLNLQVKTDTTNAKETRNDLTEKLNTFGNRFQNFVDRAVNHLLNLLPSFKFVDKSINNIQDRQDDYNLKTNKLSTIQDSITINDGAQEIYTNTNNLEKLSTFFSNLKESTQNAFKTQSEENELTASLSRGNIPSDNQNNKYSLYTTTNGNQTNVFDGIKNSIDALTKLDNLDQIQDKDLKTIVKAGIANIFAEEKNNKAILKALKDNLNTAEAQLKQASSFNQRISAWWNSVGSDKTRFILKDGQYVEIFKNKNTQKYEYKDGNLVLDENNNEITENDVILADKALHESREALRTDIAEYQKQIKELKKLTNTCKEIRHTFEKSNNKAINILSNLSFVKTDKTNILTYLTSDTNKQAAITEKTQSLLNSKLEEYQKSLENNKGEIIHRQNEILTQLNEYNSIKAHIARTNEPNKEMVAVITDRISYQVHLLKNNYNLLSSTQKSFFALFSLNPNNKDLKILCNNFKIQAQNYNNFINDFKDLTNDIDLTGLNEITLEENLAQISIAQEAQSQPIANEPSGTSATEGTETLPAPGGSGIASAFNQTVSSPIPQPTMETQPASVANQDNAQANTIQNLLKEINNENLKTIESIITQEKDNPKELVSTYATIANYLSDSQQTQNVSPDILKKLDELLCECYKNTATITLEEQFGLVNNHLNSYFNKDFASRVYETSEEKQNLIIFLKDVKDNFYTDDDVQKVSKDNEKLGLETKAIREKIPTVIDELQKSINSNQTSHVPQSATVPQQQPTVGTEPGTLPPQPAGTSVNEHQNLPKPQPGRANLLAEIQKVAKLQHVEQPEKNNSQLSQQDSLPPLYAGIPKFMQQKKENLAKLQAQYSAQPVTQTKQESAPLLKNAMATNGGGQGSQFNSVTDEEWGEDNYPYQND